MMMNIKNLFTFLLIFVGFHFVSLAQGADPEQVFKLSKDEVKLDAFMKEQGWKKMKNGQDEDGDNFHLYRIKSYGGGYVYIAAYPNKFVHYQKFNSEKKNYSLIMTYDDFVNTPEGKTIDNYSIENPNSQIKNIAIIDYEDKLNENKFYGIVEKKE
jgi:hypothetical protein